MSAAGGPGVQHVTLELPSLAATRAAGRALGRALTVGAIVLLEGEMGAGKTTLAKSICEGLGIDPRQVISPTYTLVNVYPGTLWVYHVDLFRLESPEALLDMDRADWVHAPGVTLIEWPEAARPLLAGEPTLTVRLDAPASGERRRATLAGDVGRYGPAFAALAPWRG